MGIRVGFFFLELYSVWLGSMGVKWVGRYMDSIVYKLSICSTFLFRRWNGNSTWLWPYFRPSTTKNVYVFGALQGNEEVSNYLLTQCV